MTNNELDLHLIWDMLKRYKWSIFFITLLFTASVAMYAYLLVPVYATSALISIKSDKASPLDALLPGAASIEQKNGLDTNIRILKSRKIISKVVENINISKHYYKLVKIENITIKKIEEFDPPFTLMMRAFDNRMNGKPFIITQVDSHSYDLEINGKSYKNRKFGNMYKMKLFKIVVLKKKNFYTHPYMFTINRDKTALTQQIINHLTIRKPADGLLEIRYEDTLPQRTKKIVDEIANIYIQYSLDNKTYENKKTLSFLDQRLDFIRQTLKNYGDKLKHFQEKNSEIGVGAKDSGALLEKLSESEAKIKKLETVTTILKRISNKQRVENADIIALSNVGLDTTQISLWMEDIRQKRQRLDLLKKQSHDWSISISSDSELNTLLELYRQKKELLEKLSVDFTNGHPRVIQLQKDISRIKHTIRKYLNKNITELESGNAFLTDQIKKALKMVYTNISKDYSLTTEEIAKSKKVLKEMPGINMQLSDLKRNFTLTEKIYTFLLQKRMEVEITKASTTANTKVIDDALMPQYPIKPNKKYLVAAGFLVGLILGIAIAFLRALLDTKVHNSDELEKITNIPLFGVVPLKKENHAFKEAFISLRTNLQFVIPSHKNCKILMVTSSIPSEGKTTIAAEVANALSEVYSKVLIIDLDLRKPRLFQEFRRTNHHGLSNYLVGEYLLDELIVPINERLDFLPAGPVAPNPSALLMSNIFKETIDQLVEHYDYIIMDTSPIGMVADTSLLLKFTDVLLLVTRTNYTEKSMIKKFEKVIEEKDLNNVGIVLNFMSIKHSSGYGYGYGYGYGNKYGYDKE